MYKAYRCIRLFVALIFLGLITAGCAASSGIVPVQTQSSPQTIPTVTATLPPQNTATPFPFHVDSSCWTTKPLQAGNGIKGSLIINDGAEYLYWDVNSFRAKLFADVGTVWLDLPPDRTFMPIYSPDNHVILTSPNKQPITLNIPQGEYSLTYLLNGQILAAPYANLFSAPIDNKNYKERIGYTVKYYVYDPKTGSLTDHSVVLLHFTFFQDGGMYWAYIAYSPDGQHVLYRSTLSGRKEKYGFSLLDLQSNQIKWTLPESNKKLGTGELEPFMPVWKPDASSLTYIWTSNNESKDQNFYNISLDGTVTQLTRFEELFPPGYILYSQLQWSSDMRYMAFEVQKPDHPANPELFIWDDINKTLLSPCLPVEGISSGYLFNWSFDNKHIALSLGYPAPTPLEPSMLRTRNLILDIPSKVIYELPNGKDMRHYLQLSRDVFPYSIGPWMNWEIP